jgi:predicted DNA binding CopG/RHH family protein
MIVDVCYTLNMERLRNVQLNIRVSPKENESIKSLASSRGLRVSEYLRFILLGKSVKSNPSASPVGEKTT